MDSGGGGEAVRDNVKGGMHIYWLLWTYKSKVGWGVGVHIIVEGNTLTPKSYSMW